MDNQLSNIKSQNIGFILLLSFIILNFLDRNYSNISLIALLLISLVYMFQNRNSLSINYDEKLIIYSFLSFTLTVILFVIYHSSSLHELDNYTRFILLLPIYFYLRTLKLSPKIIIYVLIVSSLVSFGSVLYEFNDTYKAGNSIIPGRHNPVSSSALTYGNLNMTLFVLLIGSWIFREKFKINSILLIIGLCASFISWGLTYSKGALVGLAFVLIYLNIINKFFRVLSLIIVISGSLIISSTDLNQRFKVFINDSILLIDGQSAMSEDIDLSIRERVFYYKNAIDIIKNNPLEGIGFDGFEDYLKQKKIEQNLNIGTSDHAHNEFLDIAVKTGIVGLFVFLALFINTFRFFSSSSFKDTDYNFYEYSGKIMLLSQIGFMLTQSQLAHHQSTVFFIILVLLFASQMTSRRNTDV